AAAHARFAAAVGDGLATDADVELTGGLDGVTAVLAAARGVRDALAEVATATDAVARLRQRAGEALHAATQQLAGRADLVLEPSPDHDWERLLARVDGLAHRAPALTRAFTASLRTAQAELTASEQELFEQTLTGSVRAHLAGRIRSAQQLVDAMNHLLAGIRTAAGGVRVELAWDVDGELDDRASLRRVRTLLLGDVHNDDERAELHDFLRRQIERVRASDADTGSWQDRLTTVLDYRTWHRFTVLVHHDRFGERPLPLGSRRVSLSAGEKTVALTLPLLAAVAAHYLPRDGVPLGCPRLLLMDELFPKVDRANKRQLLGLLPQLDLDAVFTSDKDWCDYDTLDRIAIHVVQKDGDQSLTTRFTWDGSRRLPAPVDDGDRADGPAADRRSLQLLTDDAD
nr:TIGR02680 family protein [Euzebyales bacterium]